MLGENVLSHIKVKQILQKECIIKLNHDKNDNHSSYGNIAERSICYVLPLTIQACELHDHDHQWTDYLMV